MHFQVFKKPRRSAAVVTDLRKLIDLGLMSRLESPEVLYCDPPWQCLPKHASGGAIIDYKTFEIDEIEMIIERFKPEVALGVWIVNAFAERMFELFERMNFEIV